jgi:hypothetical protein
MKKDKNDFSKISIKIIEDDNSTQTFNHLKKWVDLIEDSKKPKKDMWTELINIPGYKFKNLRQEVSNTDPFQITWIYDEKIKL